MIAVGKMKTTSVFFFCFVSICNAVIYSALEKGQDLTYWQKEGWIKGSKVEPTKLLQLTFALKQENVGKLEELLLKVSDPASKSYGHYLSVDDITNIVSPTKHAVDVVKTWLSNHHVTDCDLTQNRDFLVCWMPCKTAEELLTGAVFYYFMHDKYSKNVIRSSSQYYIPTYIAEYLDFVGGVHRFPSINFLKTRKEKISTSIPFNSNSVHVGVYPKVLRERYNLTAEDVGSHPDNAQVVAQFLEQYFAPADLSEFMSLFVGSDFVHHTKIDKIIGPNTGRSGIEASLDTQYIMGLGANITTWFWSTAGRHENQEPFLEWILAVGNTTTVPWVHSVSYGDNEDSLSPEYMKRINAEFMKAGTRGLSILFASGDDGAGCKKNKFRPSFPVTSPYVTGVGGTGFVNPFAAGKEFAYEISGGGFSNVFSQPSYQSAKVEKFLNSSGVPSAQYFNKTGRAYPDIAAISRHFWIVNNRIPVPGVAGTSASTPTVAGIISMLNEHRLHNKKPTMGFLNPFLYQNAQALFDVTSGCNEGCLSGDKGFCATTGYDPVSGNGTPNYPELVKAAMKVFA
ncbi:tripeptidyl-peptidase 1-like [Hydractinia symbiolongicarpus]|uniref:tripeptidyl-peptidase 1-like n=1 Tax=Hydractinia symbiolongicarpus TaxID=13093 RepID=UPI0025519754|nr:tripeptidyl-peptidase 1-like [Hydractinia symbiolongicarpus]